MTRRSLMSLPVSAENCRLSMNKSIGVNGRASWRVFVVFRVFRLRFVTMVSLKMNSTFWLVQAACVNWIRQRPRRRRRQTGRATAVPRRVGGGSSWFVFVVFRVFRLRFATVLLRMLELNFHN